MCALLLVPAAGGAHKTAEESCALANHRFALTVDARRVSCDQAREVARRAIATRSLKPFTVHGRRWTATRLARAHLHTELILRSGRRVVWVETRKPNLKPGLALGGGCCDDPPAVSFLAGDPEIQLADGSQRPISDITNLLEVRTNNSGSSAMVGTTVREFSTEPVVIVETADGRRLQATRSAELETPDGLIAAGDVEPGDQVIATDGSTSVTNVSVAQYSGLLYGILVDAAPPDVEAIFANGLAVGTN